MGAIRINTPVFVITGYMDCQLRPQGYFGTVVGITDGLYRVRNTRGDIELCGRSELEPLEHLERLNEDWVR